MKTKSFFCFSITAILALLGCSPTAPTPSPPLVVTPPAVPLETTLPQLHGFDQLLAFGGGGGGEPGPCQYGNSTKGVYGGNFAYQSYKDGKDFQSTGRVAYLCITGFPADKPFRISLISPDGNYSISGKFSVSKNADGWPELLWPEQRDYPIDVGRTGDILGAQINFWWPGSLPSGAWSVRVDWQGGNLRGDFQAGNKNLAEISLEDEHADTELSPVCHPGPNQTDLHAVGEGYPADSTAYVLLYKHDLLTGERQDFKLVWTSSVVTDGNGSFRFRLPYPFESGVTYLLVGVTNPNLDILGQLLGTSIASADCFIAPRSPDGSCPSAPPQRMVINQTGYVCTRTDKVNIREAPGASSTAISVLMPGDRVLVIGGPQCAEGQSWWKIQAREGPAGWVSEGGDNIDPYYICPLP